MIFVQVAPNRFQVKRTKNDLKYHGTVEVQEYDSIDMKTGKRKKVVFWTAFGTGGGWRSTNAKVRYATRDEAAKALLEDGDKKYSERRMAWKSNQGESAKLQAAKKANG